MANRGFLIRFIDIGLIVLFGFLMISDIEAASRVELAGSGEESEEVVEPEEDLAFIVVEIAADGAFLVGRREPGEDPASPPRTRVTSTDALGAVIADLADQDGAQGLRTVVLIEPHPASEVQRTVDVMDVSDRLGLQKSLQMDIEIAPATDDPEPQVPGAPSDSVDSGSGSADDVGSGGTDDRGSRGSP